MPLLPCGHWQSSSEKGKRIKEIIILNKINNTIDEICFSLSE
jgi:hypothetical protein